MRGGGGLNVFMEFGGGGDYLLRAHIHLRFRHAHHKIKDRLPSLGVMTPNQIPLTTIISYL